MREWNVECPKCKRALMTQPVYVVEYRDPRFHCRFCDVAGVMVARDGESKLFKGDK